MGVKICLCISSCECYEMLCVCVPKAFWTTVWDILTEVEKTELITPVDTLLSETFLNLNHTISFSQECIETHKELCMYLIR